MSQVNCSTCCHVRCILIRFGAHVEMLHCLEKPFSAASGGFILQNLMFDQARTNFTEVYRY